MTKVMVVDDSLLIRTILKKILSDRKHEVIEAANGKEAVLKFKEVRPEIVFMDLIMPEMDGLEATKQIINFEPDATIIVCTADNRDYMVKMAIQAGAVDYITKSFDKNRIIDIVEKSHNLQHFSHKLETDRNVLLEFLKIGINRAYDAISNILGGNTEPSMTGIRTFRVEDAEKMLDEKYIYIIQKFSGDTSGEACLIIKKQDISIIQDHLGLGNSEKVIHETLKEIGNIFTNSFMGIFNDLLEKKFTFTPPELISSNEFVHMIKSLSSERMPTMIENEITIGGKKVEIKYILISDLKSVKFKYDLKNGRIYLIKDPVSNKSFEVFKYMIKRGYNGVYITRNDPSSLRSEIGLEDMVCIQLTQKETKLENCVTTTSLVKLETYLANIIKNTENSIILFQGFEYILTINDFETVVGFISAIKDEILSSSSCIIISIDERFLPPANMSLLEKELEVLDLK